MGAPTWHKPYASTNTVSKEPEVDFRELSAALFVTADAPDLVSWVVDMILSVISAFCVHTAYIIHSWFSLHFVRLRSCSWSFCEYHVGALNASSTISSQFLNNEKSCNCSTLFLSSSLLDAEWCYCTATSVSSLHIEFQICSLTAYQCLVSERIVIPMTSFHYKFIARSSRSPQRKKGIVGDIWHHSWLPMTQWLWEEPNRRHTVHAV